MVRYMVMMTTLVSLSHASRIQQLVDQIKSNHRSHDSHSPSYSSERRIEVIEGVGGLPLQDSSIDDNNNNNVVDRLDNKPGDTIENVADLGKDTSTFLDFTQPLSVQLTDNHNQKAAESDPLETQGSVFRPSGPKPYKQRRRQHAGPENIRFRPLGQVLKNIMRPNRNGPLPPSKQPPRKKFHLDDRRALSQDPVEEFYPIHEQNIRNHRLQPGPKRPKRRPENLPPKPPKKGFSLSNPFKEILNNSPLKPRFPPKKGGGRFRPPSKTFNGFNPTFKGSLSLEEARRQYEKEKMEVNNFRPEQPQKFHKKPYNHDKPSFDQHEEFQNHSDEEYVEKPRKKRRRKPGFSKRPSVPEIMSNNERIKHEDNMRHKHEDNMRHKEEHMNRFSSDDGSDEQGRRPHQRPDTLAPFGEDVLNFGPQTEGLRPKRQKPLTESHRPSTNTIGSEDLGFFNEVSFPDISEFGMGWDPQKLTRRRREAREFPYLYESDRRRRPPPRRQGQRNFPRQQPPASSSSRRKGPGGFWDDPDFDADFFSGGPPVRSSLNSFDSYSNKYQQPQQHSYYPQKQQQYQQQSPPRQYNHNSGGYRNSRPKISPTRYVDRYSISENSYNSLEQDNSILGSGNFDIIKGGTFYDKDDYLRPYSNNRPSKHSSYYGGGNDIFSNFRDFADIKKDGGKDYNHGYDEGFYY